MTIRLHHIADPPYILLECKMLLLLDHFSVDCQLKRYINNEMPVSLSFFFYTKLDFFINFGER